MSSIKKLYKLSALRQKGCKHWTQQLAAGFGRVYGIEYQYVEVKEELDIDKWAHLDCSINVE